MSDTWYEFLSPANAGFYFMCYSFKSHMTITTKRNLAKQATAFAVAITGMLQVATTLDSMPVKSFNLTQTPAYVTQVAYVSQPVVR